MNDVNKPVSALYFSVCVVFFTIFLSSIVGQEVLVGQPRWIRVAVTVIGSVVFAYVIALILARFKHS